MEYNERLMNDALYGSKSSLKELKANASSGSAEAQYYLAMYFAKANGGEHDPDYQYWMEKAIKNGYVPGKGEIRNLTQEQVDALEEMSFASTAKNTWWILRIFTRFF